MKDFLKFTLASIVGTVVSLFVIFFIAFAIIAGVISSALSDLDRSNSTSKVKDGSILHLQFNRPIADRGPDQDFQFNFGGFSSGAPEGLNQILENIEKAKTDDRIVGIYLDVSVVLAGMASVEEIRNALIDFKTSDKWIVSYSEMYTQKAYYLASVSDEIYVYPEGGLDFRGLSVNQPFFKRMLDKLEIEPQIIRGSNNKFKSFAEPFVLEEMSMANRMQTEDWLFDLWGTMLDGLSASLAINKDSLQNFASEYAIQSPADAVSHGFVTAMKHQDEVTAILRTKTEMDIDDKLNLVAFSDYRRSTSPREKDEKFVPSYKKHKIAVIYAEGDIISGKSGEGSIGSETFAEALREAREDSTVKAVVLRVNSGGGSALASDVIYRETQLLKGTKPFIVSMGDVAASGGYYISANADKILVMPNTITGSIGVIGMIPNMKGFLNNKIGITFDAVKTGTYADFIDVSRPLTEGEYDIMQRGVDRTYRVFVNNVAKGRGKTFAEIDSIGQGHVYSGLDAIRIGLADTIGGLNTAIEMARRMASIEDFTIKNYPKRKDPIEEFLESFKAQVAERIVANELGNDQRLLEHFRKVRDVTQMQGIQMHMLYVPVIE